ncbi:MAG: hypothetical protein CMJ35_03460 [Phycisphaerae bacterium]|nr:hypothetical protein [Phycisphaerae bacterium]HCT44140.1 hypothetical protein [Phycisphaerales bacterium]
MEFERFSSEVDLRRRRDSDFVDRLIRRADWLQGQDRELVLAMFDRSMSAAAISRMTGIPARQIRKRLRQLVTRLNDPRVAYVVAHHNSWNPTMKAIGQELFVHGRTMREVCQDLGLSLHCVRKNRDAIEAMALAQQHRARPSRTWRRTERGGA